LPSPGVVTTMRTRSTRSDTEGGVSVESATRTPRRLGRWLLALAGFVVAAVIVGWFTVADHSDDPLKDQLAAVTDRLCERMTQFPVDTPSPYGATSHCEILSRTLRPESGVDARIALLLGTDQGLVKLRVDYTNLALGRQYRAEAHELGVHERPALPGARARQLAADLDRRGGVRAQPWILHYGDG
jgi:hypothetical protein